MFTTLYNRLSAVVGVLIKVIHVVRNPYDMIATCLLYRFSDVKHSADHPLNNPSNVSQAMKSLYSEASAILDMSKRVFLRYTMWTLYRIPKQK